MKGRARNLVGVGLAAVVLGLWASSASAVVYPSGMSLTNTNLTDLCNTVATPFVINEDADGDGTLDGVKIQVIETGGPTVVREITFASLPAGVYLFEWDGRDNGGNIAANGTYKISITAVDDGHAGWELISTDQVGNNFETPMGVAVNKNPASPYYGRVYVVNGRSQATAAGKAMIDGVTPLHASLSAAGPASGLGVAWNVPSDASPYNVEVGPDDTVYVTDWSDTNGSLWRADGDLTNVVEVLDSTGRDPSGLNAVHGSISDVLVEGLGGSRRIYTADEDFVPTGSIQFYDIGTDATWNAAPSGLAYDNSVTPLDPPLDTVTININRRSSIAKATDGTFWMTQDRFDGTDRPSVWQIDGADPTNVLWHSFELDVTPDGTIDPDPLRRTEAMAYDAINDWLALATSFGGNINIFDDDTKTILATFQFGGASNTSCSFDAVGNLYVGNRSAERVRAWSPPIAAHGNTTETAEFTVNRSSLGGGGAAPTISAQPADAVGICPLDDAVFTVTVGSSTGTVLYQWNRNGAALSDGAQASGAVVSGATTATLTIDMPAGEDGSVFSVTVCDDNGPTISDQATLTIEGDPTIQINPANQIKFEGQTATFSVVANSPGGTLAYQWREDTVPVGPNSNVFSFAVELGDDGKTYDVIVSDGCGDPVTSTVATLTVLPAPCNDPKVDRDGDGDVDNEDFGQMQACFTGTNDPTGAYDAVNCICFDTDPDAPTPDIDSDDYTQFVACASGPDVAVDPDCDGAAPTTDCGVPNELYCDDFNADTSAAWTVLRSDIPAELPVTFAYDYSADGIPRAPGSVSGTTLGMKYAANVTAGVPMATTMTPVGENFTGSYILKYDMWVNANGPFPGGGTGSTEYLVGGIGHDNASVNLDAAVDTGAGGWFAVDGEGGSGRDYRMYKTAGEQFVASTQYAVDTNNNSGVDLSAFIAAGKVPPLPEQVANPPGTGVAAGAAGFEWITVTITVNATGPADGTAQVDITKYLDGPPTYAIPSTLTIGTLNTAIGASFSVEGNIAIGYMDPFASVSDGPAYSFGIVDNVQVTTP